MTQFGVLVVGIRIICGVWLLQWVAYLASGLITPTYPTPLADLTLLTQARMYGPPVVLALLVIFAMAVAPRIAAQISAQPPVFLVPPRSRHIYGLAGLTVAAWALPQVLPPLVQLRGLLTGGAAGTTFGRSLAGDLTLHLLPALAGLIVFYLCARALPENPQ